MEIMVPVWPERKLIDTVKSDLRALTGIEVALMDNNMDSELLDGVEAHLAKVHGAIIRRLIKPNHNTAAPKSMMEQAATCRIAVVGVALCGSCTASTLLDSAALERRGTHTVTIVTELFERAAKTAARVQGLPDMAMAVIPARGGSDSAVDQDARAQGAILQIMKTLISS